MWQHGARRFYSTVTVAAEEDRPAYGVRLDGRRVPTPAGRRLALPGHALASAVAAEWDAQSEQIDPTAMPLMRLAGTAIDRIPDQREAVAASVAAYAETDLVCYRAAWPRELVHRQERAWDPLVTWAAEWYGAPLTTTAGLMPVTQDRDAVAALTDAVAHQDDFRLAGLAEATQVAGSLVIALALKDGRLDSAAAFEAAELESTYQIDHWGLDSEAAARRRAVADDLAAAGRFLHLLAEP